jgi:hypothetical protein
MVLKDSSVFSFSSEPADDAATEGDRGRLDTENNPFKVETVVLLGDLIGLMFDWERKEAADLVEREELCSWPIEEECVATERPRTRLGSSPSFVGEDIIPCARMDNMTSKSPRGSVPFND